MTLRQVWRFLRDT